jgi:hypothetical protein
MKINDRVFEGQREEQVQILAINDEHGMAVVASVNNGGVTDVSMDSLHARPWNENQKAAETVNNTFSRE